MTDAKEALAKEFARYMHLREELRRQIDRVDDLLAKRQLDDADTVLFFETLSHGWRESARRIVWLSYTDSERDALSAWHTEHRYCRTMHNRCVDCASDRPKVSPPK